MNTIEIIKYLIANPEARARHNSWSEELSMYYDGTSVAFLKNGHPNNDIKSELTHAELSYNDGWSILR